MMGKADAPAPAWKRVGELLQGRRVDMDTRYRNLHVFAAEREINYRLAWDLEAGARTNYRQPTLRAAEVAYGLRPGSVDTALSGGDLMPADEFSPRNPQHPARPPGDLPYLTDKEYFALGEDLREIARGHIRDMRRIAAQAIESQRKGA